MYKIYKHLTNLFANLHLYLQSKLYYYYHSSIHHFYSHLQPSTNFTYSQYPYSYHYHTFLYMKSLFINYPTCKYNQNYPTKLIQTCINPHCQYSPFICATSNQNYKCSCNHIHQNCTKYKWNQFIQIISKQHIKNNKQFNSFTDKIQRVFKEIIKCLQEEQKKYERWKQRFGLDENEEDVLQMLLNKDLDGITSQKLFGIINSSSIPIQIHLLDDSQLYTKICFIHKQLKSMKNMLSKLYNSAQIQLNQQQILNTFQKKKSLSNQTQQNQKHYHLKEYQHLETKIDRYYKELNLRFQQIKYIEENIMMKLDINNKNIEQNRLISQIQHKKTLDHLKQQLLSYKLHESHQKNDRDWKQNLKNLQKITATISHNVKQIDTICKKNSDVIQKYIKISDNKISLILQGCKNDSEIEIRNSFKYIQGRIQKISKAIKQQNLITISNILEGCKFVNRGVQKTMQILNEKNSCSLVTQTLQFLRCRYVLQMQEMNMRLKEQEDKIRRWKQQSLKQGKIKIEYKQLVTTYLFLSKQFNRLIKVQEKFSLQRKQIQKIQQKFSQFQNHAFQMIKKLQTSLPKQLKILQPIFQLQLKNYIIQIKNQYSQYQHQLKFNFQHSNLIQILNLNQLTTKMHSYFQSTSQTIYHKFNYITSNHLYYHLISYLQPFFQKTILNISILYKASDHHFMITKFHDLCDSIQNTIVIVRTEFQKVIGGFTPLKWNRNKNGFQKDEYQKSFLFSLNQKHKIPLFKKQRAIKNYSGWGPCFGNYGDLIIFDKANQNNNSRCDVIGETYKSNIFNSFDQDVVQRFSGQRQGNSFKIKQWEVYKVEFT